MVFAFFCVKNQVAWLSANRDLLEHSSFRSISLQRPSMPIKIVTAFGLIHPGMNFFQHNDTPLKNYLGFLLGTLFVCLDVNT